MLRVKPSELGSVIGTEIGLTDWTPIDQGLINQFADITQDHQYIHVDEARAKETPYGGTIAHGFLTLSMLSLFSLSAGLEVEGATLGLNYGFEKVRFLAPVPSGARLRGRFVLKDAVNRKPGQYLLTYGVTVEIEGVDTPALAADWLSLQIIE